MCVGPTHDRWGQLEEERDAAIHRSFNWPKTHRKSFPISLLFLCHASSTCKSPINFVNEHVRLQKLEKIYILASYLLKIYHGKIITRGGIHLLQFISYKHLITIRFCDLKSSNNWSTPFNMMSILKYAWK